MNKYTYKGPVKEFDTIVRNRWEASTLAVSEKKARSNLIFQYKNETGRAPNAKITLPGKIILEEIG
jgi:hypothetical protein